MNDTFRRAEVPAAPLVAWGMLGCIVGAVVLVLAGRPTGADLTGSAPTMWPTAGLIIFVAGSVALGFGLFHVARKVDQMHGARAAAPGHTAGKAPDP